jgi:hypothetical protein
MKNEQESSQNINPKLVEKYRKQFASLSKKHKTELETSMSWLFMTDNMKKIRRETLQKRMKLNDRIALILALIGVICNILASAIYLKLDIKEGN